MAGHDRVRKPQVREGWEGHKGLARLDNLVGITEAAEYLGVSRQTGNQWIQRYPSFPKPILRLRAGNVYFLTEITQWHVQQFGANNNYQLSRRNKKS